MRSDERYSYAYTTTNPTLCGGIVIIVYPSSSSISVAETQLGSFGLVSEPSLARLVSAIDMVGGTPPAALRTRTVSVNFCS